MGARAIASVVAAFLVIGGQATAAEQQLLAADGAAGDEFGDAVAIDGDVAVVGAPGHNFGQGAVYVFSRSGDTWTQTGKLTATDGLPDDNLGTSVAIDGNRIVAGASGVDYPLSAVPSSQAGAAYVFATTGPAERTEIARLNASDGMSNANSHAFGTSVAIDGPTIVVGARLGDGTGVTNATGTAYTFSRTGANPRTETRELLRTGEAVFDYFGTSVALDGDTIVVGAEDDGGTGSIYTFDRTPAFPTDPETAKLTSTAGSNELLGAAVAIEGDTILGGAPNASTGAFFYGFGYTFDTAGAALRSETAKLHLSTPEDDHGDQLGTAVAIDAGGILLGAPDEGNEPGSAYMFDRAGANPRNETSELAAPRAEDGDRFGAAVGLADDVKLISAPADDIGSGLDQGSAWVFFDALQPPPAPPPIPAPDPAPDPTPEPDPDPLPADTTAPVLTVDFKEPQKFKGEKAAIKVTCDEDCSLVAKGTFKLDGEKKQLKLKKAKAEAPAGDRTKLKLLLKSRAAQDLARLDPDSGKAKLELTATDAAGNETADKLKIKLT